jgi:hypothetical protein
MAQALSQCLRVTARLPARRVANAKVRETEINSSCDVNKKCYRMMDACTH